MIRNTYGNLFHHNSYGEDAFLLRESLYEIAEHLGHTAEDPISMSLLCLEIMMPYKTGRLIYTDVIKLIEKDPSCLKTLNQIKEIIVKHFPDAEGFSEMRIRAFAKAMAKCWMPELMPYLDVPYSDIKLN